ASARNRRKVVQIFRHLEIVLERSRCLVRVRELLRAAKSSAARDRSTEGKHAPFERSENMRSCRKIAKIFRQFRARSANPLPIAHLKHFSMVAPPTSSGWSPVGAEL